MQALAAFLAFTLAGLPAALTPPAPTITDPVGRFPVVLHVAVDDDGAPVLDEAAIADWFRVAQGHFAPAGIELAPEARPLPAGWHTLESFRDRHRLKRFLVPRRINVFVLGEILDPVASAATERAATRAGFEPSGRLAGAHIESPRHTPATYVILSAKHGSALSLTHELGHFFGVAHHRDPDNIMSYGATRSRFDARQLKTFRSRAKRHRRDRTIAVER
ncbi:MAG: hypothetical protein OXT09_06055 [Myxococcales bacterium]|nr:hypothetical protein [Myxococcales bacterium]